MGWESAWGWVGSVGKYKPRGGCGREGLGGGVGISQEGGERRIGVKIRNSGFLNA